MYKRFYFILPLIISLNVLSQNEEFLFSPKGIAEVHITLDNNKQIGDIKNEKHDKDYSGKLDGTMLICNSSNSTYAGTVLYNGKIQIDGRGNTTWGVPKKPYNIDLVDNALNENPAALLDMPESDEWALLAFWHDRSLMRIPLAMYLGQRMNGIPWTPRLRYVELWINDEYRGLYCLSEKVQRGSNRVDLKKLSDSANDQSEPNVSGGYLLEGSSEEKLNEIEKTVDFRTSRDINFSFKYPKAKNVTSAQRDWIRNYLNEFENVLWGSNFKDPVNGYQKYMEPQSFIDWTILHEQSKGPDNLFHASTFVSKERNKKLNMNAPWDFDLSYGNGGDRNEAGNMVRTHRWFARLAEDPAYFSSYKERFDELRPLFLQIPQIIEANYQFLKESGALEREKIKWPQILTEYNPESNMSKPTDYHAHARYLSDWIASRDTWCYIELGQSEQEKAARLRQTKPIIRILNFENMENGSPFNVRIIQSNPDNNTFRYYWNDSQTSTSNQLKTISAKGKYWVKIVDSKANISLASDTLYFGVDIPNSIETPAIESVYAYYDANHQKININFFAQENNDMCAVSLIDIRGSKIMEKGYNIASGYNQLQMQIPDVQKGMYILHVRLKNASFSKKIML